ncbi:hypothetical protein BHM03_00013755 [Ensete ventricosum]|nr:hypothetical protein BHM03_00013755 [Ensete ventricosum]
MVIEDFPTTLIGVAPSPTAAQRCLPPPELPSRPLGNTIERQAPTASTSIHSMPESNTLSSNSIDSLKVQLRLMNRRIYEVQKEFIRLKEELEESSTGGSPFVSKPSLYPKGLVEKQIDVIIDRLTSGDDNSLARKAYTQAAAEKRPKPERDPEITFMLGEEENPDHNDTLVISTWIANTQVKRIMVDIGIPDKRWSMKLGVTLGSPDSAT